MILVKIKLGIAPLNGGYNSDFHLGYCQFRIRSLLDPVFTSTVRAEEAFTPSRSLGTEVQTNDYGLDSHFLYDKALFK